MTNQAQRPPGTPRSASPRIIAPNPGNSADNLGLIVLDQFQTVASVHCRHSSGLIEYPLPTRLRHSNCHAAMACLGKAVIHSRCLNNSGIVPKGAAAGLGVLRRWPKSLVKQQPCRIPRRKPYMTCRKLCTRQPWGIFRMLSGNPYRPSRPPWPNGRYVRN